MDPAYKRIINERLHYDAGNYSISRLYMDLTSMSQRTTLLSKWQLLKCRYSRSNQYL